MHARVHVGNRHAKQGRRLARHTDQRHGAALGFGNQAKAGACRVRAGMAVGRHRAVHQLGVALGQLLVPQAQLVQRTGAVVFHKHISAVGQLVHHLQTTRVAQVDAQALLAHVLLHEVAALATHHGRAGAARVTCDRSLDLDDFGAHGA